MKRFLSIILIITCIFTLGACAKKQNPVATPTPAVNTQEGGANVDDVIGEDEGLTEGENQQQSGTTATSEPAVSAEALPTPTATVDPGVDLEEDILTGNDVATPAPTQTTSSGNAEVTATPTAAPTATATLPPLVEGDTVISLPMDFF